MKIKGKLGDIRLLVSVLLFSGMQLFAQAEADLPLPAGAFASHRTTRPHADVFLISDRTFLMKDIEQIAMSQSFKSQSAPTIARLYGLVEPSCSSSIFSVGVATSFFSDRCPVVDCPAPPPGCFYQGPPDTGPNGCPINCGTLVCGPEQ